MFIQDPKGASRNYQRIVCLVPSLSTLLFDLGLNDQLIAVTKFCVHPKTLLKEKAIIGGTKNINLAKIASLNPDLIIANKEENVKELVEALAIDYPVLLTDINNYDEAIDAIIQIGVLTNRSNMAQQLAADIETAFLKFKPACTVNAAYLIWKDPYMTAGGDTFIHAMMQKCGLINAFGDRLRYPEVKMSDLSHENIRIIFLSSEPYPFKQQHIDTLRQTFPDKLILLADGEMFSWYGSKMLQTPAYFTLLQTQIRNYVS